jgi:Ca2+/Na+ antiporter
MTSTWPSPAVGYAPGGIGVGEEVVTSTSVRTGTRSLGLGRPAASSVVSTPAVLGAALVAVLIVTALAAVTAVAAVVHHRGLAEQIDDRIGPLVVRSQDLYVELAALDAAASTGYLRAGLETDEVRSRYTDSLDRVGLAVATMGAIDDIPESARFELATIGRHLPTYAALVEAARVNGRLQYPIGAAYLRDASDLMRAAILPAATSLYTAAADELDEADRAASSSIHSAVAVAVVAVLVALLVATQAYLTWRTRRVLNLWLLGATVVLVAMTSIAAALASQHRDALAESRSSGASPLFTSATARILVLRSLAAENLDLVERGTVESYVADFEAVVDRLDPPGGSGGLIAAVSGATADRASAERIGETWEVYLAAHRETRGFADVGEYDAAIEVATTAEATAAATLDSELAREVTGAARQLRAQADRAADLLALGVVVSVMTALVVAALATNGLRRRIGEYR